MANEISSIPEEIHDVDEKDIEFPFPSKEENSEVFIDEFCSMLDEGFDYSISNGEETDIDTYVDTLFTMLSDSDELPEEMQDSASTYLKETNSNNELNFRTLKIDLVLGLSKL